MKIFIYGLSDDTGIRYIGQSLDPEKRFRDHLRDKKHTHKVHWIKKLLAEGKMPELCILEETDETNFGQREEAWIAYGRANGWKLTNLTDGGKGPRGHKHKEEARQKMAAAKIGNSWNKGRIGNNFTEETRRKVSLALTGHVESEETRQKKRIASTGRKHSLETRRKLSELHSGKVMSAEAKQKMSEAKKGSTPWNKGLKTGPLSDEHKNKLSEANIAYHKQKSDNDLSS